MTLPKDARQSFLSTRNSLKELLANEASHLDSLHLKLKEIIEEFDKALVLLDTEQINFDKILNQASLDNDRAK